MKLLGKQAVLVVSSVVFCCSFARTQNPDTQSQLGNPYTHIAGNATTCTEMKYDQVGHETISDQKQDKCSLGNAKSRSLAALANVDKGFGEVASVLARNGGGAAGRAEAVQTAILTPPKGFKGTQVQFSFKSLVGWIIQGVEGVATGHAQICIAVINLHDVMCQEPSSNGEGKLILHGSFPLKKSSKGFYLTIWEQAYAEAAGHSPAPPVLPPVKVFATTVAVPKLHLPKGWTCKFDSGTKCVLY